LHRNRLVHERENGIGAGIVEDVFKAIIDLPLREPSKVATAMLKRVWLQQKFLLIQKW
jgi:hypothetical protein